MSPERSRRPWGVLLLLALAGGATAAWQGGWFASEETEAIPGAPVRRGPLRISVLQRGSLEAKNSVKITNELEGQTAILSLVPEGVRVEEGQLLVVLDDSNLRDRRDAQQITVHNAEAEFTKAKQQYEIQSSQNESDIAAARQRVEFARTDLEKYLEGDAPRQLQEAEEAIVLAQEEEASAKDRLEWSRNLAQEGFLTRTELERDELAFQRAGILLEQAKRRKDLLIRFDHPKQEAQLRADQEEAKRELERVELQAHARLVDYEAALRTSEARLELETEKLRKLDDQIDKARIHAPASGIVVYSREGGGRWGDDEPIQEGKTVREREEILTIPREGGMTAEVSVHETVLEKVEPGLPCIVRVDALPGREFAGRVEFVAILPDRQSWWANPNQRVYKTEVALLEDTAEMRPGMNCSIEILVDELRDVLYVPVQSVFYDGGETIAFVANGGAERRTVEVGQSNEQWVEIRSGLSEGEFVLLTPPADFTPKEADEDGEERGGGEDGERGGGPGGRTPDGLTGAPRGDREARDGRVDRGGRPEGAWPREGGAGRASGSRGEGDGEPPEGDRPESEPEERAGAAAAGGPPRESSADADPGSGR